MGEKEPTSTGTGRTSARAEQGNASWPSPEDGLRLMHAFLAIKQVEVREAIIKYAEEQLRLQKDR
jgi:hypothetical protein